MKPLRWGVTGAGGIARRRTAPEAHTRSAVELVGQK